MISVADALARCLALCAPLGVEQVALRQSVGRTMPAPARASRNQPPFAASAMDGYAVAGDPVAGDCFTVVGEAGAGHGWTGKVAQGQAVRIFTGAPVPDGATRVVIQEDVIRDGDIITLNDNADSGSNIRPAGQDFRVGDMLGPRVIGANDVALLAAMNHAQVQVTRKPVVALIATGDELVMPGETPRDDQIIASNTFALAALVEQAGGIARILPIARDTRADLETVFGLAAGADLIVTIGGASVGDHDLVADVAAALGMERAFYKIAMRPGKPLMAGRLMGAAMLGLPGNPVSSIVCAHLFLLPMLRQMLGQSDVPPRPLQARLAVDLPPNGPRAHYMRARLVQGENGPEIAPFEAQDSSLLSILTQANALLIRPVGAPAEKTGSRVEYLPL